MNKPSKEITNSNDSLLLDKPILLDSEDKLERSKIVDAIKSRIDMIFSHKGKESMTIGIEGSWGSGKTSIINLLLNKFDKNWRNIDRHDIEYSAGNWIKLYWTFISSHMNFYSDQSKELMIINSLFAPNRGHGNNIHDSPNTPLIIFFNPWNYSNDGQILNDFFRAINNAIEKEDILIASEFRSNASKYIPNIMDSKNLGIEGSLSIWPFGVSAKFSKTIAQQPVYESKDLLDKTLEHLNKKILIIVDDIDRLDVDETLLIFKLTKIVADFPNMVFVLAYDKDKTIKKIHTKFEGNNASEEGMGDNFIDKIVQYHFHIPKTHRFNYEKYFGELVEIITKYFNVEISDEDTWNSTYIYYLYSLLQTPRSAKKYINSIMARLSITGAKEINLLDFLLIEAIRIYAIDVYNSLHNNILELVHDESIDVVSRNRDQVSHDALLERTCEKAPAANKDIIVKILSDLFPFHEGNYKIAMRICSKSHYDKYFTMQLNPEDIPVKEREILEDKLNEGSDAFIEYAKKFKDMEHGNRLTACKIIINSIDNNNDTCLTNLLLSLWELSESDVWPLGVLDASIVANLILNKLDNYNIRKKALVSAINNVNIKHSYLYFLAHLSIRQKQIKKEELLIDADLDELCNVCIKQLESESKIPGGLINRRDLQIVLDFWFKFGKENDLKNAKKFALELLRSNDILIKLLHNYVNTMTIPTSIDRAALSKYFDDISIVDDAVAQLDKSKLNERDVEIIDWYENALNISSEKDNGKTDT